MALDTSNWKKLNYRVNNQDVYLPEDYTPGQYGTGRVNPETGTYFYNPNSSGQDSGFAKSAYEQIKSKQGNGVAPVIQTVYGDDGKPKLVFSQQEVYERDGNRYVRNPITKTVWTKDPNTGKDIPTTTTEYEEKLWSDMYPTAKTIDYGEGTKAYWLPSNAPGEDLLVGPEQGDAWGQAIWWNSVDPNNPLASTPVPKPTTAQQPAATTAIPTPASASAEERARQAATATASPTSQQPAVPQETQSDIIGYIESLRNKANLATEPAAAQPATQSPITVPALESKASSMYASLADSLGSGQSYYDQLIAQGSGNAGSGFQETLNNLASGIGSNQNPYLAKMDEYLSKFPGATQPTDAELLTQAQQLAQLQIDPQRQALQRSLEQLQQEYGAQESKVKANAAGWDIATKQAIEDAVSQSMEAAIAAGGGRSGIRDYYTAQATRPILATRAQQEATLVAELNDIASKSALAVKQAGEQEAQLAERQGLITSTQLVELRQKAHDTAVKDWATSMAAVTEMAKMGQDMTIADRQFALALAEASMNQANADRDYNLNLAKQAQDDANWKKEYALKIANSVSSLEQADRDYALKLSQQLMDDSHFQQNLSLEKQKLAESIETRIQSLAIDTMPYLYQTADQKAKHEIEIAQLFGQAPGNNGSETGVAPVAPALNEIPAAQKPSSTGSYTAPTPTKTPVPTPSNTPVTGQQSNSLVPMSDYIKEKYPNVSIQYDKGVESNLLDDKYVINGKPYTKFDLERLGGKLIDGKWQLPANQIPTITSAKTALRDYVSSNNINADIKYQPGDIPANDTFYINGKSYSQIDMVNAGGELIGDRWYFSESNMKKILGR